MKWWESGAKPDHNRPQGDVMAFQVKLDVTITKDGNPFFAQANEWSNMPYEHMNAMEKYLVSVLEELTKKGAVGGEWGPPAVKK